MMKKVAFNSKEFTTLMENLTTKYPNQTNGFVDVIRSDRVQYILLLGDKSFVVVYDPNFEQEGSYIGYVRVSTENQSEQGNGVAVQVTSILGHCLQKNAKLSALAFDLGITGDNAEEFKKRWNSVPPSELLEGVRPAMNWVLHNLNGYNRMVAFDTTRLWREADIVAPIIQYTVMIAGSDIECVTENRASLQNGSGIEKLATKMQDEFAGMEKKKIVMRTRDGRRLAAKEGKKVTSKLLYGYFVDEEKYYHINEAEASIIRRIFNMDLQGYRKTAIAEQLNREGIPGPQGTIWSIENVKNIIYKTPLYYGIAGCANDRVFLERLAILPKEHTPEKFLKMLS